MKNCQKDIDIDQAEGSKSISQKPIQDRICGSELQNGCLSEEAIKRFQNPTNNAW